MTWVVEIRVLVQVLGDEVVLEVGRAERLAAVGVDADAPELELGRGREGVGVHLETCVLEGGFENESIPQPYN